ncbi:hypothetical protein BGZ80_007405, partial [Entomortierella chlamydospora]
MSTTNGTPVGPGVSLANEVSNAENLISTMAQEYAAGAQCCNQTPCFIGCPVD